MSLNGSGVFNVSSTGQPVVANTLISAAVFNALTADVATALSTALYKDGQQTVTANLPMATYRHTGVGSAVATTDYARYDQVQNSASQVLSSVSGADTITANATPTPAAYAAGQTFRFVSAGANTGAVTLNVSALGAKAITKNGTTALVAGDIPNGAMVEVSYDGTRFQLGMVGLKSGDIGVTVQAYDADTAKTDVAQTFTLSQRGTVTTDNDLSFDLNATNNFSCTPTAGGALTFTNITAGQSGFIKLVNGSNYAITAHANTKVTSTFLATISATGTYIISYFSDGTNVFCASAGAMV